MAKKEKKSNSEWVEFESEDGMFGFGMAVSKAVDLDKIQSFVDYMRLRYSELMGLKCFDYDQHVNHLISCEIGDLSHAAYQLTSEVFSKVNWSEGFDELAYRRLLGDIIIVLSRFHDPKLRDRITDNAPYWSKDLLKIIRICDKYVKERGGEGVDRLLAGVWLNTAAQGDFSKMPGAYDWIVCEPLALPEA